MRVVRWAAFLLVAVLPVAAAQERESQGEPEVVAAGGRTSVDAAAGDGPQADPDIVDMDAVVVTGIQPGPGLWRVSHGDHVLWILGTVTPLPRGMEWDTKRVEEVIAQSQQVLLSPSLEVKAEAGFFGKLALIPSAIRARRNPDGKTLQDLLAPGQYARWQALKARYIGRDSGIEQWRPVFAALELYDKAIRGSGMRHGGFVTPVVRKLAKRHGVPVVDPELVVGIPQPKQVLREFSETSLDDTACLRLTLDRIEGDLDRMAARANAWSIGDIDALRDVPSANQFTACTEAFTGAALARKLGMDDVGERMRTKWIDEAEQGLRRNRSTFAILPMSQLLRDDGYLAELREKGYAVEAP